MNDAARPAPVLAHIADLLGLLLLVLAVLTALRGGLTLELGLFELTMSRSSRVLAEAFALLLVRQAFWPTPGVAGRVRFVAFLAGLLCGVSGESEPRWIGDGLEYLAMAQNLAAGSPPALTPPELQAAAARFGKPAELIEFPLLLGADGRQDFPHFWFYPLLASPFVRLAGALGVSPIFGFTALNIALLCAAAAVMLRRLPPAAVLLITGSSILWWVDKAHTEVFTLALLAAAAALLEVDPPWALPVLAAAATQNPPLAVLALLAFVYLAAVGALRDRRLRIAVPLAVGLSLLHPLYYMWRLGRWSPLLQGTTPHVPTFSETTAVLWDPNLGILLHYPALALIFGAGLWGLVRSSAWRRPAPWFVLVAAGFLLVTFAQSANLNHGGTRGPSRYGLWLIAFAIPALLVVEGLIRRAGFALLVAASLVGTLFTFHPRLPPVDSPLPQGHLLPSPFARWLWTRAPGFDNPLPEVFVERTAGREEWILPAVTTRCEKALLPGTGEPMGLWPLTCPPAPLPPECVPPRALCYANRSGAGYSFTPAPRQASFFFFEAERWFWRARPGPATLRLLERIPWEALREAHEGEAGLYLKEKHRVGTLGIRQSERALLVWLDKPRPGAQLTVRLPCRMTGVVVAPGAGDEYAHPDIPADTDWTVEFPWVWPMALLLVGENTAAPVSR